MHGHQYIEIQVTAAIKPEAKPIGTPMAIRPNNPTTTINRECSYIKFHFILNLLKGRIVFLLDFSNQ